MRAATLLAIAFCATAAHGEGAPAAPAMLSIDTQGSSLTYHLVHKLHKIDGTSKQVEGKARIIPGGQAQVAVRAPVESFDSGNSNRDAHMKEAVEAARYTLVELKAATDSLPQPATFPAQADRVFKGEISFHGVRKSIEVPVKLTYEGPERVRAQAQITISLDEFKIERPSLMFVKVDDAMKIDANLVFKK